MITIDTFQKFGRDGAEAAMRSFGAVSNGAQTAATETVEFAKRSFEHSSQTMERLMGVRTLDAALQLQTEYLRTSYEGLVAQTSKMGELSVNVAKDAFAPVEGLFAKAAPASA